MVKVLLRVVLVPCVALNSQPLYLQAVLQSGHHSLLLLSATCSAMPSLRFCRLPIRQFKSWPDDSTILNNNKITRSLALGRQQRIAPIAQCNFKFWPQTLKQLGLSHSEDQGTASTYLKTLGDRPRFLSPVTPASCARLVFESVHHPELISVLPTPHSKVIGPGLGSAVSQKNLFGNFMLHRMASKGSHFFVRRWAVVEEASLRWGHPCSGFSFRPLTPHLPAALNGSCRITHCSPGTISAYQTGELLQGLAASELGA